MTKTAPELDTASAVLDAVRSSRSIADREEARLLALAIDWAAMHSTDSIDDAACDWFADQPIPVAGPGAPLVAEFSIAELATALGMPTEIGKAYVGEALELRHRLPKVWARVTYGDLAASLCRRHHRLKTHGRWRYRVLDPGAYLWTSPHRYQYLVDDTGTADVSRERAARTSAPDE